MNDITLSTLIEEKFRAEVLGETDLYRHLKQDWLIDEIISLLKAHPELKARINIGEMSINKILTEIEQFFKKRQKTRKLDQYCIYQFINTHQEYRVVETMLLLLVLGFSFKHSFIRMKNNQKSVGEVLDIEPTFTGVVRFVEYGLKMPVQKVNSTVKSFYELVCSNSVSNKVISKALVNLELQLNQNPSKKSNISTKPLTKIKK